MSSDRSYTWPVAGDRVGYPSSQSTLSTGILAEVIPGKNQQPTRGRVVRRPEDIQEKDVGVIVNYDELVRVPPGEIK